MEGANRISEIPVFIQHRNTAIKAIRQ